MADEWPLQSFLELGALAGAVPCARLHTRHILWEWGMTALRDDAELLVSELVTNAVQASQSMEWIFPVRLRLLSDREKVMIVVWDANPKPPVRTDAGEDDETGRGLILVDAISQRWDWNDTPDTGGKAVWCIVTVLSGKRPVAGWQGADRAAGATGGT
jgi:anti-sigma regulatory factor (Ser/Thr protein kinase)